MSSIPNSAMPHAGPTSEAQDEQQSGGFSFSESAGRVAELVRENPRTAAAAGVAIVGAVAAAAIPLVRGRGKETTGSSTGSRSKNGGKSGGTAKKS
jgi:hypothetical protein